MNKRTILALLLLAIVSVGGYFAYKALAPKQTIIRYTTIDGKIININTHERVDSEGSVEVEIVSNTYSDGEGELVIAGELTSIWPEAFYEHAALKSIVIPEGIETIDKYAFLYCTSLTDITLPKSLKTIEFNAFSCCSSLETIKIPKGVTSINRAFVGCSALRQFEGELASPDGRCLIIDHRLVAFAPSGLTSYKVPTNLVGSIGMGAFEVCNSLKKIVLPRGITSIGNVAFLQCEALESVTIPESVKSIGNGAFARCKSLTHIQLPEGLTKLGMQAFMECSSLFTIAIPRGVEEIGDFTFAHCTSLLSVSLPWDLTTLGRHVFENCKTLNMLTLPSKLKSIDKYALGSRSYVRSIHCDAKVPPKGGNQLFGRYYSNIIITVPAESYGAYKADPEWQSLSNRLRKASQF